MGKRIGQAVLYKELIHVHLKKSIALMLLPCRQPSPRIPKSTFIFHQRSKNDETDKDQTTTWCASEHASTFASTSCRLGWIGTITTALFAFFFAKCLPYMYHHQWYWTIRFWSSLRLLALECNAMRQQWSKAMISQLLHPWVTTLE